MSKYNSKKIVIDGYTFDSKDEGLFYEYLKELKAMGQINNFELKPKFTLIPAFSYRGQKRRKMTYELDFKIYKNDGSELYIDVKGMSTQQGEMRRKLFEYFYPELELLWVSRSLKYGLYGWIEYDELIRIRRGKRDENRNKDA